MKYYVAADGGGTKLLAILYDENFHILRSVRTAGTNTAFKPADQVKREVEALAEELFADGMADTVREIESMDLCIVGDSATVLEAMRKHTVIRSCRSWGEGETALGAAGVLYGCVAQAGTGSDAFLIQPDEKLSVGGFGALLGDEGSGYDIGLRTLKAAIYASDGRGPDTKLLPLLLDRWKLNGPWDLVRRLIGEPDYRRIVASASYLTELAADEGDPVAISIYEQAGHELAVQMNAAIAKAKHLPEGPIVTSGGAWKGSARMFETFRDEVLAKYPGLTVTYPVFEPVVGCVILRSLAEGKPFAETEPILLKEFGQYRYPHK